jgi:hypothetical protein
MDGYPIVPELLVESYANSNGVFWTIVVIITVCSLEQILSKARGRCRRQYSRPSKTIERERDRERERKDKL